MRPEITVKKPTGATKVRHFRVPDRIFNPAAERAAREGATLSDIVRERLRDYAEGR